MARCQRCCLQLLQLAGQLLYVGLLLVPSDLSGCQLWCQLRQLRLCCIQLLR